MTYDEFLRHFQCTLAGHYLLHEWFPDRFALETPHPPEGLSEDEEDRLKERLRDCMPLDSMMVDLWDWDIHFEDLLEDDWYFEAAFGLPECVDERGQELADFFLEQVDERDMDYNQQEDPDTFREMVEDEARKFVRSWRENIFKKLVHASPAPDTNH